MSIEICGIPHLTQKTRSDMGRPGWVASKDSKTEGAPQVPILGPGLTLLARPRYGESAGYALLTITVCGARWSE